MNEPKTEAVVVFMTAAKREEAEQLAKILVINVSPPASKSCRKSRAFIAGKAKSNATRKF